MTVVTGFGYLTDAEGHIVSKYELPVGDHPLSDGYSAVEVESLAALDLIEVWVPPPTPEEIKREQDRASAIDKLKLYLQFTDDEVKALGI